jgi:aromatic amino acid permease
MKRPVEPPAEPPVETPVGATSAEAPEAPVLQAGLQQRHMTMLALGGVIGSGLFLGSGAGVATAGPAVLLSYLAAGVLAMLVMRMMGEMSAAYPASGAFSVHAERSMGRWAGFTVGWLYWFMLTVVIAVEATGAASIVHGWVPAMPVWAWVLVFMVVFTGVNLGQVKSFGEFEFWFAALKVAAIVGFLVLGGLAIFGLLPDTEAVGLANLTGHGGFLPEGWGGVAAGLLSVAFAFGGMEVISIAAAESAEPARAVGRAVRSAVWRILVFYLGSMLVIVTLLPWTSVDSETSPFVQVLDKIGVSGAGQVMNVVVLVALLSALNANLYGASRMVYSLGRRGEGPPVLARVSGGGVPRAAVLASVAFGFVSVGLNYWAPDRVFTFMLNAVGAMLLVVWAMVAVAQLRLRRRIEQEAPERLVVPMWGYPYLTWLALAGLAGIFALMLSDAAAREQLLACGAVTAVVLLIALVRELRGRSRRRG